MITVIKTGMKRDFFIRCDICKAELTYRLEDVVDHEFVQSEASEGRTWTHKSIKCPECGEYISVNPR